ncbi:MAG: hypothetical protein ABG776_21460 [Cyanobacteria bacterium J06555_13]
MMPALLDLRYKPKKKSFQGCQPCEAFKLFDWVIWLPDSKYSCRYRRVIPRTVLCLANAKSLRVLNKLKAFLKNTTVVIAGEDTNLSAVLPTVETLLPYCSDIYYEAKDIDHSQIKSFCMGFTSFYLKRVGLDVISELSVSVSNPMWEKQGLLAAWGGIFPALDQRLSDRRAAIDFVESCAWIQREALEPADYWKRLAESKFLLAPAGRGVQSPKLAEAWLMRTVPIVTDNPCFRDLQRAGFPLLILKTWNELTQEVLQEFEPKRSNIDWGKIQFMLTLEYFRSHYLFSSNSAQSP